MADEPERDSSWVALLGGPVLLLVWGYPGARDPRGLTHLAGAGLLAVAVAYVAGAVWVRKKGSLLAAFLPGLAGAIATCVAWQRGAEVSSGTPLGSSFEAFHSGMHGANASRFVGFGLAACLFLATALYRRRVDARGRVAAWVLGTLTASGAAIVRASGDVDRLWSAGLLRADRIDALLGAGRVVLWTEATATLAIVAVTVFATARWRDAGGRTTAAVSGAAALALLWGVVDASMLLRVQTQKGELYAALAPEFTLLSRLDPPPLPAGKSLPAPPAAPTLELARDRLALDDQPVGRLSAFQDGGLDEVLRADLSRAGVTTTLSLMVDREVPVTAVSRALQVAHSFGVRDVALLYTRGREPELGRDSETAYTLPQDFGALHIDPDPGTTHLAGELYDQAAAALLRDLSR